MIITCTTNLNDILKADEFKDYQFNIERVTALIRLLEYIKMDNIVLQMYLDDKRNLKIKGLFWPERHATTSFHMCRPDAYLTQSVLFL